MPESPLFVAIPWEDGSNDHFYLNFEEIAEGNDYIQVTSDLNESGIERTRVLRFKGAGIDEQSPEYAQAEAVLKIVQTKESQLVATFNDTFTIYEEITPKPR